MTDWPALHRAVVEELDSDEPRLVLADALQAVGDPRGEFIALQCELARLGAQRTRLACVDGEPDVWLRDWVVDAFETCEPSRGAELRRLVRRLLEEHGAEWFAGNPQRYRVERGFVEHADAEAHPRRLFDVSPTIESMALDLGRGPDETWFAEPRMLQLRQLFIDLAGPVGVLAAALHFLERAQHLRQLRYSYFDNTLAVQDAFPPNVCATLEALGLDIFDAARPDYLSFVAASAPRLRHLEISGHIAIPWQELGNLELLELDRTVEDFAAIPRWLPKLRALRLHEPFDSERFEVGTRALGEALPELRVLDLSDTAFRRFLQDLVGGSGLASLTHLSLRACALDDNALDYLLRSPLGHRLQHLDLGHNPLTERSVDGLAELTSLRRLRLEYVPISQDALARLRARLPNTEIL